MAIDKLRVRDLTLEIEKFNRRFKAANDEMLKLQKSFQESCKAVERLMAERRKLIDELHVEVGFTDVVKDI